MIHKFRSMINGIFIINNQGKPRLSKFYEYLVCIPPVSPALLIKSSPADATS